jgi:hypothetical protein
MSSRMEPRRVQKNKTEGILANVACTLAHLLIASVIL